jgi:uncharacterized FlaG/YvyC family protein
VKAKKDYREVRKELYKISRDIEKNIVKAFKKLRYELKFSEQLSLAILRESHNDVINEIIRKEEEAYRGRENEKSLQNLQMV